MRAVRSRPEMTPQMTEPASSSPSTSDPSSSSPRILLSGVFGPFGVDDAYGRKENIMELFHNQVTKAQGLASFRYHHRSFGLYFLAENVDADVTVLDFPTREHFEREVRRGQYDVVGISFITPNFVKAREMARIVRRVSPRSKIVVGGHGAAIEGVDQLIDCDQVVKGEGIRWLRSYLGQDPNAPLVHPALPSTERQSVYGIPVPGPTSNLLVPGVGCINGCKFCSTSHFFERRYTGYLQTGAEVFETACRLADARGTHDFFVMDENFLKNRQRAMELLELVQEHRRYFNFEIFSSAETLAAFGIENLVRLGVMFVWIGVESSTEMGNFAKNVGVNAKDMVRTLREHGIHVLASGILCQEHHTPDNIQQDIDFLVELESDFVQFMLLTPLPVTGLYEDHKRRGLLRQELPFEEWHGQKYLSYKHPHFDDEQSARWIERAFTQDYERNSSSIYRVLETVLRGYRTLKEKNYQDPCWQARVADRRRRLVEWSAVLGAIESFPVNEAERQRVARLRREICREVPEVRSPRRRLEQLAAKGFAAAWRVRLALRGDMIQPKTLVTHYPAGRALAQAHEGASGCAKDVARRLPLAAITPAE